MNDIPFRARKRGAPLAAEQHVHHNLMKKCQFNLVPGALRLPSFVTKLAVVIMPRYDLKYPLQYPFLRMTLRSSPHAVPLEILTACPRHARIVARAGECGDAD